MTSAKGVWRSAGITDTGRRRDHNEDAFTDCPEAGLWVVADGMGGHDRGEVASAMVCEALGGLRGESLADVIDEVDDAIDEVNDRLLLMADDDASTRLIGCTVVALLARGRAAAVMWAGDSRAYLFRDSQLSRVSEDHSLEADLSPGTPREGSVEHVITRAVGAAPDLALDIECLRLRHGDRLMLCSDGLSNEVDDSSLSRLLARGSASEAARSLIDAANMAGGRDNISVIVADYRGAV